VNTGRRSKLFRLRHTRGRSGPESARPGSRRGLVGGSLNCLVYGNVAPGSSHADRMQSSGEQGCKPTTQTPPGLSPLGFDAPCRDRTLRSSGCGKSTVPGLPLEIELVFPAQHAVRLVHGLPFDLPVTSEGRRASARRASRELPNFWARATDLGPSENTFPRPRDVAAYRDSAAGIDVSLLSGSSPRTPPGPGCIAVRARTGLAARPGSCCRISGRNQNLRGWGWR
jgi:hypothetical protein